MDHGWSAIGMLVLMAKLAIHEPPYSQATASYIRTGVEPILPTYSPLNSVPELDFRG